MERSVVIASGLGDVAGMLEAFLSPDADPRQARRREGILKAATDLFIAHGYRKTTIEDVAAAAGVAKGTVYLYYRNKAELMVHAVAYQKLDYLNEMAPVFDPTRAPADRLRAFIALSIRLSHEMPLLTRFTSGDQEMAQVFQEADPAMLHQVMQTRVDFAADLIDEVTGHSWPRASLEKRATVLMDLLMAAVLAPGLVQDSMPLDEYARELADVIVGGLERRGP